MREFPRRRPDPWIGLLRCSALAVSIALPCKPAPAQGRAPAVRDSAGVRIVQNTAPAWPKGSEWRVEDRPIVDIGVFEGDSNYQLDRVQSAMRLADGQILVANGGTNQLRFYDGTGRFARAVGRKGAGPGEFNGLAWVRRFANDSLLTYDNGNRRLAVFTSAGEFVRTGLMQMPGGAFPRILGVLADQTLFAQVSHVKKRDGAGRDSSHYVRYSLAGEVLDTVRWFPTGDSFTLTSTSGGGVVTYGFATPFGRQPQIAVTGTGDGFFFGLPDTYEIGLYTTAGALSGLYRLARANAPVTTDAISRYRESMSTRDVGDQNARRTRDRMLAEAPIPRTAPAYESLFADDGGNLWVADYRFPGDTIPRWSVFSTTGVFLGVVRTPPGLQVMQIGGDFILGVWRDPDEIEHVRMYRLVKRAVD